MILNKVMRRISSGGYVTRLFSDKSDIKDKIAQIIKDNKVVIFMKGVPEQPRCGFSNAVIQILRMHNVTYDAHNVLEDETLRQGLLIKIRLSIFYVLNTRRIWLMASIYLFINFVPHYMVQ